MELFDAEIEWALTHNIEPADHLAGLTRVPENPIRLSPEQTECEHPSTHINLATLWLECAECGTNLMDLNPMVCSELREPRSTKEAA